MPALVLVVGDRSADDADRHDPGNCLGDVVVLGRNRLCLHAFREQACGCNGEEFLYVGFLFLRPFGIG